MADVIRTKADLITRLGDNSTQDISPQDLRDFLISFLVFGELGFVGNTVEQSALPAGVNIVPLDLAGPAFGVTNDTANNWLKVPADGNYRVSFEGSYKGTGASRFTFSILKNGVPVNRTKRQDTPTVSTEERNVSGSGTISLLATDEVKLGIQVQPAGGDFTLIQGGIRIERLD